METVAPRHLEPENVQGSDTGTGRPSNPWKNPPVPSRANHLLHAACATAAPTQSHRVNLPLLLCPHRRQLFYDLSLYAGSRRSVAVSRSSMHSPLGRCCAGRWTGASGFSMKVRGVGPRSCARGARGDEDG